MVFFVSDSVLPKRGVEFYHSRNPGILCWLTNCRTKFSYTSTCYFLVHSCKAAGCSGKNSSHPPSGTRSPNPTQPRPPASHGCKKRKLGFTSGLSTIYCSRRRCSGSRCMTSGTGCTSILEICSTVISDSFSYLAPQKQEKSYVAFRKASIYSAHYKQMWHIVTPTTLSDTQSWTEFESVRSSTAIASRGTSSHGRSTSVSSRCPENDDKIIRRNSNDKYSHHTAGGPTNTSCRSTQTRLGSTSTSNATTCSPTNTRSSRALKQ